MAHQSRLHMVFLYLLALFSQSSVVPVIGFGSSTTSSSSSFLKRSFMSKNDNQGQQWRQTVQVNGASSAIFSFPLKQESKSFSPFEFFRVDKKESSKESSQSNESDPNWKISPPPSHLTVLIPAYNERNRIESTLNDILSFLSTSNRWKHRSSILVVDDGSRDGTQTVIRRVQHEQQVAAALTDASRVDSKTFQSVPTITIPIECIALQQNGGKGCALAHGIQYICQHYGKNSSLILTTDADGSASIQDLDAMYDAAESMIMLSQNTKSKMIVSTTNDREYDDEKASVPSIWDSHRETLMLVNGYRTYSSPKTSRMVFRWGFRTLVRICCGKIGVRDSQCGFKLMTVGTAHALYNNLHLTGWAHDVEVFYRVANAARRNDGAVLLAEQAVEWQDKDGSKLTSSPLALMINILTMLTDVIRMRLCYSMGLWQF